jgi:hypothetical protein
MEAQLRIYTIKPDHFEAWLDEWREHIAPLRERLGFRVLGPWIDDETRTFVWILEYDRDDGFAAADARYYESEERRSLDPDPARHLASTEARLLRRLPPRGVEGGAASH